MTRPSDQDLACFCRTVAEVRAAARPDAPSDLPMSRATPRAIEMILAGAGLREAGVA
ncbi:MAG TPA: hypothetical protein VEJ42_00155 [Streptosporangiaceae bacterium]|nr:hypothetical protein [Streptosporangiaceae bacterium]